MTVEPNQPPSVGQTSLFEAEAMAVESLLGSPRPNLPSRMQRIMTPLRRLLLRCIGAIASLTPPQMRAKARPDGDRDHTAMTDNQLNHERQDG